MPVYFIRPIGQRGPVKIGCANFPLKRLDDLMAWSPFPLEVVATVDGDLSLERRLHGIFAASHTHKEWFAPSVELDSLIGELKRGTPIGDCIDLNAPLAEFRNPRKRSDESRKRMSYSGRLRWAFQRLKASDAVADCTPPDIYGIMDRWSGWGRKESVPPTAAEFLRLEEVIADPAAHAVTSAVLYGHDEKEAA